MTDDDKSLVKDTLNTPGWKLIDSRNKKAIEDYRFLATQQNVSLEDRLWYSAKAMGREEALAEIEENLVK